MPVAPRPKPLSAPRRFAAPTRGFALLITIILMAFLVLLAVSFATLTRVEVQVATNSQQLDLARTNALTALNIAVGQLQKYAGPDKRVTARAEITSASSLRQPYLTGVWKTTNTNAVPDVWLVSGNEVTPTQVTPANAPDPTAAAASNEVFLVDTGSVGATNQRVKLTKTPLTVRASSLPGFAASDTTPITTGNYAWWIGDEGVKVSSSLPNPNKSSSPIAYDNSAGSGGLGDNWSDLYKRNRLDYTALPRPRLEKLFTAVDPDSASTLSALSKVLTPNQLSLLPAPATLAQIKTRFHDVTSLSRGVLSNVASGGLKKDLSDLTCAPDQATAQFLATRPTSTTTTTLSGGGQSKTVTQATYNLMAARGANGLTSTTAGPTTYPQYSISPILTQLMVHLNFYINSSDQKVHYSYKIGLGLGNPYAATLQLTAGQPLTLDVKGLPPFTLVTKTAAPASATLTTQIVTLPTLSAVITPTAQTWSPGQTVYYEGTTTLPVQGSSYPIVDLEIPGATAQPTASTVEVTPSRRVSSMSIEFKLNGQFLVQSIIRDEGDLYSSTYPNKVTGSRSASSTGYQLKYYLNYSTSESSHTNGEPSPPAPITPSELRTAQYRLVFPWGNWGPAPSPGCWYYPLSSPNQSIGDFTAESTPFMTFNKIIYNDLPRQEVTSLGMLTHQIQSQPWAIGNAWGGASNSIFDNYHLSTVPRYASTWTAESGLPLPNRYATLYRPFGQNSIPLADLTNGTRSARYLLTQGAFNINSTSVAAWTAVLGSKFTTTDNPTAPTSTTAAGSLANVFYRLPHGAQECYRAGMNNVTWRWDPVTAGRNLTDAEITSLATQIVAQLRTRGKPYLSLQDFINGNGCTSLIDDAIAQTTCDLTAPVFSTIASTRFSGTAVSYTAATNLNHPFNWGTGGMYKPRPIGSLLASDVIGSIAPFMTPRSDTFTIRTYGDVVSPVDATQVRARAWCEAVVQRVPDLAANPNAPIADVVAGSETTYPFGRKFKIISFRWLSSNEL